MGMTDPIGVVTARGYCGHGCSTPLREFVVRDEVSAAVVRRLATGVSRSTWVCARCVIRGRVPA